eukprot:jgi/Bigna1/127230/aug1.4_g1938
MMLNKAEESRGRRCYHCAVGVGVAAALMVIATSLYPLYRHNAATKAPLPPLSKNPFGSEDPAPSTPVDLHRKNSVDIVLAHYNENLTWTGEFNKAHPGANFRIYSKSSKRVSDGNVTEYLPNVGRESHSYLHHIVKNYDDLADWTIFSQAAEPAWGFFSMKESGHMCSGSKFEDYLLPRKEGWYMVYTVASHFPDGAQNDRLDMMFRNKTAVGSACPVHRSEGWGRLQTFESLTVTFANGARFAASKQRIRMRPKSYYEDLLELVSWHTDPIQGFYLEAMWYDVFHPMHPQGLFGALCEVPQLPSPVATHAEMYRSAMKRFLDFMGVSESQIRRSGALSILEESDAYLRAPE